MRPRASTLRTPAWLATLPGAYAIRREVTSGGSLLVSTPLAFFASV
jgi:hypothetical protein